MKNLNLSILTSDDGSTSVNLGAKFDDQQSAIDFHAGVAELCKRASGKKLVSGQFVEPTSTLGTVRKMLGHG